MVKSVVLGLIFIAGCAEGAAGVEGESESEAEAESESESEAEAEAEAEAESESEPEDPCENAPSWTCLGAVKPSPAPTATEAMFASTLIDFATELVMPDVTLRVCARADVNCEAPLDETTTDSGGGFELTLPLGDSGFNGYIEVSGGGAHPSLGFLNPPVTGDFFPEAQPAITTLGVGLLEAGLEIDLRDDRAHIAVVALDCGLCLAEGVSFSSVDPDAESTQVYIDGVSLSTGKGETDASGGGGWVNVPLGAGTATVTATVAADDSVIGFETILLRAGTITFTSIVPE